MFWEFDVVILRQISYFAYKKLKRLLQKSTIMQDSKLSLVMDTIGIIGMFFVAALLLCS